MDPTPYRKSLAALGKVGETARAPSPGTARNSLAKRASSANSSPGSIPAPSISKSSASAQLPTAGTLAHFAPAFKSLGRDARDADAQRTKIEAEIAEIQERLAGLAAAGPLPTESVIDEARATRDRTWRMLRSALLEAADAPSESEIPSAVGGFEDQSERADRLADAASRAAARLADYALENRRLDAATRAYALVLAAVDRAEGRRQDIERQWFALWEPVGVLPRSPVDMRSWREMAEQARDRRARLATREKDLETRDQDLARVAPTLRAIADEIGARPHEGLDVARLAERVERRLDEIGRTWQAVRERDVALREGELRLRKAVTDSEEAAGRLAEWRERWARAVSAIGLAAPTRSKPPRRRSPYGTRPPTPPTTASIASAASTA